MSGFDDLRELNRRFDEATRDDEVVQAWGELTKHQRDAIRRDMRDLVPQLLELARPEIARYEELRLKEQADRARVEEALPRKPRFINRVVSRRGWLTMFATLALIVVLVIEVWRAGANLGDSWRTVLGVPLTFYVAWELVLLVLLPALANRYDHQIESARQQGMASLGLGVTAHRMPVAQQEAWNAIRDKGMLGLIRASIGAIKPDFSTRLQVAEAPGLDGAYQEALEIETPAHRELRNMLQTWTRGSIGLAGPRGAGKSTLIRSFCRDRTSGRGHENVLGIAVSAPVEYQVRDFLLHLFALACHRTQEWEAAQRGPASEFRRPDGPAAYNRLEWKRHADAPAGKTWGIGLRLLAKLSRWTGTLAAALASLAITLAWSNIVLGTPASGPGAPTASATATASAAGVVLGPAPASASPMSGNAVSAPSSVFQRPPSMPQLLGELGIKPAGVFSLAVWLGLVWALGILVLRSAGYRALQPDEEGPPSLQMQALRDAQQWLALIKFQHSFTEGWGGGVKLPVGLEVSKTSARSLAQAALTMPEIVDGFTRFLTQVRKDLDCKIVIGIDELDKLADVNMAQRFLNDIKAIFDVDGVFFLVSVSEDAMSQFERRGLPFRDAFDSAFDKVVPADYLRFADARRLIDERVVGLPVPFQALCYCLSGGLARELIRHCRELLAAGVVRGTEPTLAALARALVRSNLDAKVKAVGHAVAQVVPEPQRGELLMKLHRLRATPLTVEGLLEARAELQLGLGMTASCDGDEMTPAAKLDGLRGEIGCYVYYLATLLEFFNERLDADCMKRAMQGGALGETSYLDQLAQALQSLAVDPGLARGMLDLLRVRGWSGFGDAG